MGLATKALSSSLGRAGKLAGAAMVAWGVTGLILWARYGARGAWYAEYGSSQALLSILGVSSLACFFAVAAGARPAHERSRASYLIPSAILVLTCLVGGVLWIFPRPTVTGALAAAEAGDKSRAAAELDAVEAREGALPPEALALRKQFDQAGAAQELADEQRRAAEADDERLSQVSEGSLAYGATLVLRREWTDPDKQNEARKRLLERAGAIANDAWAERQAAELARIAKDTLGLDQGFTASCEARAALAAGEGCAAAQRWDCVGEALAKLEEIEIELGPELVEVREALVTATKDQAPPE